jgi:hypothetical protein
MNAKPSRFASRLSSRNYHDCDKQIQCRAVVPSKRFQWPSAASCGFEDRVYRLLSIAPEVMETFSPASCPAAYALESK